jgi:hypothetical protein
MIKSVTVRTRNAYNNSINKELSLSLEGLSELCLRPIEGLGPVKANVNTVDLPMEAGGIYLSSKNGQRNIVFTVEFRPDWSRNSTVTALRKSLMQVMMPTNLVELIFHTDELDTDGSLKDYTIKGVVETHEPSIFSKDPVVQISILCADPYFKDSKGFITQTVPINGPSLIKVPFPGEVPNGFIWEFEVLEPSATGYSLRTNPARDTNYMKTTYPSQSGDIFRFSTIKDNRWARHIRGGVTTSILGWFSGSLVDTKLVNGDNYFTFPEVANTKNLIFKYERVYGGI